VVQRRLAVSRNSAMANHSATVRKLHPKETAGSRTALQVARQVSATIGLDFFQSIVQHLGRAIAADCVYIGEFVGGPSERVKTLAACLDGQPDRGFEYTLAGSASAQVATGRPCMLRAAAQKRFPTDSLLLSLHAQACVGIPLLDSHGRALGVIMAIYRQPARSLRMAKSMLEIFAPRAAAELNRKQSEERLRESEQRYRAFIAKNPDGMWRIEFENPIPTNLSEEEQLDRIYQYGYIAECNDSLARFLGLEKEEQLVGCRVSDLPLRSDPSMREATLAAIRAGYWLTSVETRPLDQSGNRRYMLRTQWGIVENGILQRLWGTTRDITELRHAEQALGASEQRMVNVLQSVHLVVTMLGSEGSIAFCNDYLFELTGWQPADVVGKNWIDLMIPIDEREKLRTAFESETSASRSPLRFESTLLGRKGGRWWIAWDCTILRDSEGKIAAIVNVGRDITEYKELEAQFRHAQKLESIGRLAGSVAHDFNNLLTIIVGYSTALLVNRDPEDPAYIGLAEIRKAAEKGAELAYQLLTFSRRQARRLAVLNLNTLVAEDLRMLRRLIGENIELVTDLDPALGLVRADAGHIHQILMNLAVNARDAMPGAGTLVIASSNVDIDESHASRLSGVSPGPYIRLTVTDTGVGMSEEVRAHLFEPFFTTKEPGKGTGLGLSTVYGIVRQSGGHILVNTEPNKGTVFEVFLPRIQSDPPARDTASVFAIARGTEKILLVEDDEEVRVLTAKILRELGYTVWEAKNAAEALEATGYTRDALDLILTDLVLPGIGGMELADRVKSEHNRIKVLYMSGYADRLFFDCPVPPGISYLRKPFTPDDLAAKVRETLDRD
jgi:two-component system cell cycle sensor histidine kinase/response regulator CckA